MHIIKPRQEFVDLEEIRNSLRRFLLMPGPDTEPPCPGCTDHQPDKCNSQCGDAAYALSSEPDKYPIESRVVPLVYGIMSTCVTQSCWSCEGHMDHNANLVKLPKVSFYSSSPVYPQLIYRHLSLLMQMKKLAYPWHVVISDYAQTLGMTYTIEPQLSLVSDDIRLGSLQADIRVISDSFLDKLRLLARNMLKELDEVLPAETM